MGGGRAQRPGEHLSPPSLFSLFVSLQAGGSAGISAAYLEPSDGPPPRSPTRQQQHQSHLLLRPGQPAVQEGGPSSSRDALAPYRGAATREAHWLALAEAQRVAAEVAAMEADPPPWGVPVQPPTGHALGHVALRVRPLAPPGQPAAPPASASGLLRGRSGLVHAARPHGDVASSDELPALRGLRVGGGAPPPAAAWAAAAPPGAAAGARPATTGATTRVPALLSVDELMRTLQRGRTGSNALPAPAASATRGDRRSGSPTGRRPTPAQTIASARSPAAATAATAAAAAAAGAPRPAPPPAFEVVEDAPPLYTSGGSDEEEAWGGGAAAVVLSPHGHAAPRGGWQQSSTTAGRGVPSAVGPAGRRRPPEARPPLRTPSPPPGGVALGSRAPGAAGRVGADPRVPPPGAVPAAAVTGGSGWTSDAAVRSRASAAAPRTATRSGGIVGGGSAAAPVRPLAVSSADSQAEEEQPRLRRLGPGGQGFL